jgi:Ca2+/Na+ antiporter
MKVFFQDLLVRLTSRKLWLAVGTITVCLANKQYIAAVTALAAYLGINVVDK